MRLNVFTNGFPKTGNHGLVKACELIGIPATVNHRPFEEGLPERTTHHVHIKRDPRNVVISMLRFNGEIVTPGTFIARFRRFQDASLPEEMARFQGWLTDASALTVAYEDLIADDKALRRIAAFVGTPYIDGAWERLPGEPSLGTTNTPTIRRSGANRCRRYGAMRAATSCCPRGATERRSPMSELLVLVRGSNIQGAAEVGDVIAVHDVAGRWGKEELSHPRWRILRTDRPLLQTHVTALCSAPRLESFHGGEHFRLFSLDLSKLPRLKRPITNVSASAIENATYKREVTGEIPAAPVSVHPLAAAVALIPLSRNGEKRIFSRRTFFRGMAAVLSLFMLRKEASAATITKTIGSAGGRDYSTIQAFITALPADLVADGNSYVGACYNDSEFTGTGTFITLSALTTDATHTLTLTAATGQSFQDNASVRSNALKYNASNGVAVRKTDDYGTLLLVNGLINYYTISRLQFSKSATGAGASIIYDGFNPSNAILKDLICEHAGSSANAVRVSGAGTMVLNVLSVIRSAAAISAFSNEGGNVLYVGCGAVRPTDFTAGGTGYNRIYSTPILLSSYGFGFTTSTGSGFDATGGGANATDQAAIAGLLTSQVLVTYNSTTPFTSAADATRDFRAIAATSLVGNGSKDAVNAPNDISGAVRPTAATIGVWEQNPVTATNSKTPSHGSVM